MTEDISKWIKQKLDNSLAGLKKSHPRSEKGVLPKDVQDYLDNAFETIDKMMMPDSDKDLLKYGHVVHLKVRDVTVRGNASGDNHSDELMALLTRKPVVVELSNNRKVGVTAKSLYAYRRLAVLQYELSVLEKGISELSNNLMPETLDLMAQLSNKHTEVTNEIIGIALHQDATPPEDAAPPVGYGADGLTPEDLMKLLMAHLEVGPLRYQRLPDPASETPGHDGKSDPSREGWGFFLASFAKKSGTTPEKLEREDIYSLLAMVKATRDIPSDKDENEAVDKLKLS